MNGNNGIEVADIFRKFGPDYRKKNGIQMSRNQWRAMRAIEICRTAELGGHIDKCDRCGKERNSYNSCRNRNCPKCQFLRKEKWAADRIKDLLPIEYFHIVFTIPHILNPIALRNQKEFYGIFFKSVSETLLTLSEDPKHLGAKIGFISILHTWGQNLSLHPHVHSIVTGGGLSKDGKNWISCKEGFFIYVKVLSSFFRNRFLQNFEKSYKAGNLIFSEKYEDEFSDFIKELKSKEWVVYSKPPFKNPETVIRYLARYTHRIAISNQRIKSMKGDKVSFTWKDYADNNRKKMMTFDANEFIRRFLIHVLPLRFVKIRHYGILSHRNKKNLLPVCKNLLGVDVFDNADNFKNEKWQDLLLRTTGRDVNLCPYCKNGNMIKIKILPAMILNTEEVSEIKKPP